MTRRQCGEQSMKPAKRHGCCHSYKYNDTEPVHFPKYNSCIMMHNDVRINTKHHYIDEIRRCYIALYLRIPHRSTVYSVHHTTHHTMYYIYIIWDPWDHSKLAHLRSVETRCCQHSTWCNLVNCCSKTRGESSDWDTLCCLGASAAFG